MKSAAWVLAVLAVGAAARADGPVAPPADLVVRLEVRGAGGLKASDVSLGLFPSGRRCTFTYTGARSPQTIALLSQLGFRTTVYVSPSEPAERLAALEKAGADLGIDIWGGKMTYASHIGANSIQEAFDAVITSRLVLRAKCAGPLACGAIAGHYGPGDFPVNRDPDNGSGFGYAYHDGNYLLLSDNKPYMVYLGRQGQRLLTLRENFDNRIESVPNELVYYTILAHQFRGTVLRAEKGQIVRFSLRDFKAPDLEELSDVIGPYGKSEQIWHASEAEIGANEYVRRNVTVESVGRVGDGQAEISLRLSPEAYAPFLLTPLPLKLPKTVQVAGAKVGATDCTVTANDEGVFVDVPLGQAVRQACAMTMTPDAPDMTAPDRMGLTLTVRNATDGPIRGAGLQYVGTIGLTLSGESGPFDLEAKGLRTVKVTARTTRQARFGINPVSVAVRWQDDGRDRLAMEGFEVVVAPRLRVEVDPMQSIPLPKGRSQHFFIHLANGRSSSPGGPPNRFISHKAGPCRGTVRFDLPLGMKAVPEEQPFELSADDRKTLIFRIANDAWASEDGGASAAPTGPEMVRPVIRFEGEDEPVCVLFPGTIVLRQRERVECKALDDTGLLVAASWDDNTRNGRFDRSVGNPAPHFYPGHRAAYNNEGVKGWCMNSQAVCQIHDTYRNIDFLEGTALFWVRKDPSVRNENTYVPDPKQTAGMMCGRSNQGETLFTAGAVQNVSSSDSGITLRRFRSWQGKEGYLQLTYQLMGHRVIVCQAGPFEWSEQWRHVGLLWSVPQRRLELYLDGKLAAKADPGPEEQWYAAPWDRGRASGWNLQVITSDHGAWCGSCRDELYIHNRPLSEAEIQANRALAEKK